MQLKSLFGIILLFFLFFIISLTTFTYIKYVPFVNNKDSLINYKDKGITLYDRHGDPFYYLNNSQRDEYVKLGDISSNLQNAIIATEDKNFYHHHGISLTSIARSVLLNLEARSFAYGGSTITQQLIKNTLLSSHKSIARKLQEALLAMYIETRFSKKQILEMYLNTVYYGDGSVGIAQASKIYFNKKPSELTLAESSYLAGILKSPALFNISEDDKNVQKTIQKEVLDRMVKSGYVSNSDANKVLNENIQFKHLTGSPNIIAPHFALYVESQLKDLFGKDVVYDGLKVKTTLDLQWQKFAEAVVKDDVDKNIPNGVTNGAVVVMDPQTGEILVYVGSKDWFNEQYGKVDMAQSPRQPGSSFKPIVYSIALDQGLITPSTMLVDMPQTFVINANCHAPDCVYKPNDFDGKFRGPVTVRRALANSLNIPSVEVMQKVGLDNLLARAPEYGVTSLKDSTYYGSGLSLVLGSAEIPLVEMTNAYTTFANNGQRSDPISILEVRDKFGKLLYTGNPQTHQVIDSGAAYLISSILSDSFTRSEEFGTLLNTPFPAAVKTGTTENFRDAWTLGYTPNLVIGVWTGNNDASPIHNLTGSLAAAPIWKTLMEKYYAELPFKTFKKPDEVVAMNYCTPNATNSAAIEYFIKGTEPAGNCVAPQKRTSVVAVKDKDSNVIYQIRDISIPQYGGENGNIELTPIPPVSEAPTPSGSPTPTSIPAQ